MNVFASLLKKEIAEQLKNYKFLISGLLFLFFAILSPVTAKYLPEIIAGIGNIPGMAFDFPEPTYIDSISQYIKNLSQIVLFVLIFLTMGIVAVEKDKGTAAFVLVKPVPRHQFILAKVVAMWLNVTACLLVGAAACYVYTLILFGSCPAIPFVLHKHSPACVPAYYRYNYGVFQHHIQLSGCRRNMLPSHLDRIVRSWIFGRNRKFYAVRIDCGRVSILCR